MPPWPTATTIFVAYAFAFAFSSGTPTKKRKWVSTQLVFLYDLDWATAHLSQHIRKTNKQLSSSISKGFLPSPRVLTLPHDDNVTQWQRTDFPQQRRRVQCWTMRKQNKEREREREQKGKTTDDGPLERRFNGSTGPPVEVWETPTTTT